MAVYGGVNVAITGNQLGSNQFYLNNPDAILIPSGNYNVWTDGIASVQLLDPVSQIWMPIGAPSSAAGGAFGSNLYQISSDGTNYRVANSTSCPIAALLTTAGTGYTSAPTVTPSEGNSKWLAIVGGAVSTTVTVVNGGTSYTYPPLLIVSSPTSQGIQAVIRASLTTGAVSSVTVVDQGAGYATAPQITVVNDPRDTTGNGAVLTATLTGANTVTGVLCTDPGYTTVTSGTVPTLTFSGGGGSSAAATAIMDWVVLSYGVTGQGAGYSGTVLIETLGSGVPTTATAYTNPHSQASFLRSKSAMFRAALSGGGIVAAAQIDDVLGRVGGVTSNVATLIVSNGGAPTTVATLTLGVGGVGSWVYLQYAGRT